MEKSSTLIKEQTNYCERGQLAINVFNLHVDYNKEIIYLLAHPEKITNFRKLNALISKSRHLLVCSLKMAGVRYVQMAEVYELTACRVTQMSLDGLEKCFEHLNKLDVDESTLCRHFNTRGFLDLPFVDETYIEKQEIFLANARAKGRKIVKHDD